MHFFITGGAGFIGCNLAAHHLQQGNTVTVFDNLSRLGTQHNLAWLRQNFSDINLKFVQGDIRDFETLLLAVSNAQPTLLYHLAGQVAVTTSVQNPREDFEINALGTFNVLEAARMQNTPPAVFYASTNKVYGGMEDIVTTLEGNRYIYRDYPTGISEQQPLDFHSPYGCSKGSGDQYVRDYARIYNLKTVVFRQSCIYGERQFGVTDQGWVAHFIIAAITGKPITIYGDGKQVRDLLYVQDLIQAYEAAYIHLDKAAGQAINVGGGAINALSIWSEFSQILEEFAGHPINVTWKDWRPGDQPVFISDNTKAQRLIGWQPSTNVRTGLKHLWNWALKNQSLFITV